MMSHPSEQNQNKKGIPEPFGEFMKSVNHFLHEQPVRSFLQTIDEFFKIPFPSFPSFHVDLTEDNNEYLITAKLPGVKREQIQLNVLGNHLTISVDHHQVELEEDDINQIYRHKQFQQRSSRTIALPRPINEREVKATYRDGLLQIRIPQNKGKVINIDE